MPRQFAIAGSVALLLVGVFWWLLSGDRPDGSQIPRVDRDAARIEEVAGSILIDLFEGAGVAGGESSEIDLGAGAGALRGWVSDPEGSPAPGAEVFLYRSRLPAEVEQEGGLPLFRLLQVDGSGGVLLRDLADIGTIPFRPEIASGLLRLAGVRTDASGRYAFTGLAAGRYIVAGRADGTLVTPTPTIQYVAETDARVDIALVAAGDLTGVILGEDGSVIEGAQILLRGEIVPLEAGMEGWFVARDELLVFLLNPVTGTTRSDADGHFRFSALPPLDYQLFVEAAPWAATEKRHSVPEPAPIEIVLALGGTIEGVVSDRSGEVVPAVEVVLSADGGPAILEAGLPPRPKGTTDEEGRFRFDGLAEGAYRISVQGAGWQPQSVPGLLVAAGEILSVDIEIDAGVVIEGIVRDPRGSPVPDVNVSVRTERGAPSAQTMTDRSGAFALDTLSEGTHTVSFRRDGWLVQSTDAPTGGPALDITLEPGPIVSGRLVASDGTPVAQGRIQSERDWRRAVLAESVSDGRFEFSASTDQEFRLLIRAATFAETTFDVPAGGGDLGDIALAEAVRIEGVVLDPDGAPLPGARVTASRDDPEQRTRWRSGARDSVDFTDAEGAFSIEVDDPTAIYEVTARYALLLPSFGETISLGGSGVSGIVLSLRWGASFFGAVVGPTNSPVEGAVLEFRMTGDGGGTLGRGRKTTRSRTDGEYQVVGLEAGGYELRVSAPRLAQSVMRELEVGPDEARRVDVHLEPEQRLTGVVADDSGAPIDQARISVSVVGGARRSSSSDPTGSFIVDRLGREELTVAVESPGFLRYSERGVFAQDGPLEVVLRAAYEITGVVLDQGTEEPIPNARARITPVVWEGRKEREVWGRTDAEGRFTIGNLAAGDYQLQIAAEGYVPFEVTGIRLPTRPSEDDLVVLLRAGGRIRGTVYDMVGSGLADVRVRAFRLPDDEDAPRRRRGRHDAQDNTDEEGKFVLHGLVEGRYEVRFEHGDYLSESEDVVVSLDRPEPLVTASLERGAEIEGRVYSASGAVQNGGNVILVGPLRRRVKLEEGATFRFAGLPPGTYQIRFVPDRNGGENSPPVEVELRVRQRRSIDLHLGA